MKTLTTLLLGVGASLSLALVTASTVAAQPLPAVCPNGGPNYAPYALNEFLPANIGTPMLRHTLSGASSVCNDGSPAVMFIRPSTAFYSGAPLLPPDQHPNRWVIFFDGGGGCGAEDDCLARWCGISGFNRAGKMSTDGVYDATPGMRGIFKRNPAINQFAGYNHVLLYYCSSDNWIGSETHLGLVPSSGPSYDLEFQGEAIVADAFDSLIAGVVPDAGPAATFWNDAMPSLLNAEEIVLAAESAGGGGLRHHVDRLRDMLLAQMPTTNIVAVVDAGTTPSLADPAISWADPSSPTDYTDYLQTSVDPRARGFWGAEDSALDQSCLDPAWTAAHNAVGSHPEICLDTTYTLFEHITTPIFLRQDINDTLGQEKYIDWALIPGGGPAFRALQYDQNVALASYVGLEPKPTAPGVFGPRCNRHVSIQTDTFFTHEVSTLATALPFHDLLVNWMAGVALNTQNEIDTVAGPGYTASYCP